VKHQEGEGNSYLPFNGMHIILFGDFHQYLPVGNPRGALYSQMPMATQRAAQGHGLYKQFDVMVD